MPKVLHPYTEYKRSSVPWLEKIPAHWDECRNGRLFSQRKETGFGELPILEVSLRTGVRVRDMENLKRKQVMSDREKYKRAAKGDIAYNMMRMWQGAAGVAPVDGLVSPAYVVLRPFPDVDSYFFAYLFRTESYMKEVDAYSRGIVKDRNRLYWEDFKRMSSIVPPPVEQRQIVQYLDSASVEVNRLIRNKRRLIELLKEQNQNIINQALTWGLDPDVPLKPSGVEWLGDIPEHWEVRRIRTCLNNVVAGIWGNDPNEKNLSEHITCVRVADYDMRTLGVSTEKLTVRAVAENAQAPRLLKQGDILMEKSGGGDAQPVGRVVFFNLAMPAITSNFIIRIRVDNDVIASKYLLHILALLQATQRNIPSIKQTTGIQNLDEKHYFSNRLGLPSLNEQQSIIEHIEKKSAEIDQAISRAELEIELICEYRIRLISDVVTGKVDVRGIEFPEVTDEELIEGEEETEELGEIMEEEEAVDVAD